MRRKDEMRPGGDVTRRKFLRTALVAGAVASAPSLWVGGSLPAMAAATAPLDVFKQAVDAFNKKQGAVLGPLLDPHVVLRKIHQNHQRPIISDRQNVIDYLNGEWNGAHPVTLIFDPYFDSQQPTVKYQGPDNSVAVVSGNACWNDNDGDNSDGELKYEFKLGNSSGGWLITSLSGWYTTNPPKKC